MGQGGNDSFIMYTSPGSIERYYNETQATNAKPAYPPSENPVCKPKSKHKTTVETTMPDNPGAVAPQLSSSSRIGYQHVHKSMSRVPGALDEESEALLINTEMRPALPRYGDI